MKIREVTSRDEWEAFVTATDPHTFLQSWNWGETQARLGKKIIRLGVYDNAKLIAAALLIRTDARRGRFLFCPHGPIFGAGTEPVAILDMLMPHLKRIARRERCVFIRVSPLLLANTDNNALFKNLGFHEAPIHMMHPELAWMLDITASEEELLRGMRKTTRYCVRRAPKEGITVQIENNAETTELFWELYAPTAERHKFVPFSKKYLRSEFEVFRESNQVLNIFALHNGKPVSGAMIIFYGNSAFYHHGASLRTDKNITTTSYLLQWEAIKEAKRRGKKLYNFWGIVESEKKNHPWAGITLFKKGFGGFAEHYVHAKDFAISPRYWMTYIIERIRTIKRGYSR